MHGRRRVSPSRHWALVALVCAGVSLGLVATAHATVGVAGPGCPAGGSNGTFRSWPDPGWTNHLGGGYTGSGCADRFLWKYANGPTSSGYAVRWTFPNAYAVATCKIAVWVPSTTATAHPAHYTVYQGNNGFEEYWVNDGTFTVDQLHTSGWGGPTPVTRFTDTVSFRQVWVVLDDSEPGSSGLTGHQVAASAVMATCTP